jgi:hypothetical protein
MVIAYWDIWVRFKQLIAQISVDRELDALRESPLADDSYGPLDVRQCKAVRCAQAQTKKVVCWSETDHSMRAKLRFHVAVSLTVANGQLCGKEFTGTETCESCDTLLQATSPETANPESSCRIEPTGTVVCDGQFVVEGNGLVVYPRAAEIVNARETPGVVELVSFG